MDQGIGSRYAEARWHLRPSLHGHEIPPGRQYGLRSESRCARVAAPGSDRSTRIDASQGLLGQGQRCDRAAPGPGCAHGRRPARSLRGGRSLSFRPLARSVKQLVLALEEFRSLGIDFISHQEALDTSTPMGEAMFAIIAAMAQLERSIIRERVQAGIAHARLRGTGLVARLGGRGWCSTGRRLWNFGHTG